MKEKNDLDKCALASLTFVTDFVKKVNQESEVIKNFADFEKKALKCDFFIVKKGNFRSKIYWCNKINKACTFYNCLNIN